MPLPRPVPPPVMRTRLDWRTSERNIGVSPEFVTLPADNRFLWRLRRCGMTDYRALTVCDVRRGASAGRARDHRRKAGTTDDRLRGSRSRRIGILEGCWNARNNARL